MQLLKLAEYPDNQVHKNVHNNSNNDESGKEVAQQSEDTFYKIHYSST